MADTQTKTSARRRSDPLTAAAAVFFVCAVAAAAYPAFRAGPVSGAGLLLLVGLGGFSVLGVFALSGPAPRAARPSPDNYEALVEALAEPAAVAAEDGRVLAANPGWRGLWHGADRRLPRGAGEGLYAALAAARSSGAGEAEVSTQLGPRRAAVSRLGGSRLLLRLQPEAAAADAPRLPAPVEAVAAPARPAFNPTATMLDAFAAAAPFGAALLDGPDPFEARILRVNEALVAMADGAASPGRLFAELIDPAGRAEAHARLAQRPGGPVEVRLALSRPKTAHLYVTSGEGRRVAYLLDVSEQKQLELQLAQSQKMQAIGQLAGGVAHDFNNLLTAIQLRLDELLHRHPVGDPSYEGLNEIRQTGVRAADLVRKLLAFSRKQTVQRETLELGSLMSEFEVLLRRLLREDVRLVTDYGRDPPLVRADRGQLETAVMNLAVNARDALRSHGSANGGAGVVRIRTARLSAKSEACALGYPRLAGGGGRADRGGRQRAGHTHRGRRKNLRALLHHQARGRGHGAGPRHRVRHRQAGGRLDPRGDRPRPGRGVPHLSAHPRPLRLRARARPRLRQAQARATRPVGRRPHPVRGGRGRRARGGGALAAGPRLRGDRGGGRRGGAGGRPGARGQDRPADL